MRFPRLEVYIHFVYSEDDTDTLLAAFQDVDITWDNQGGPGGVAVDADGNQVAALSAYSDDPIEITGDAIHIEGLVTSVSGHPEINQSPTKDFGHWVLKS